MEEKEVILTQEGYDKIEKELEFLRTEKRTEIAGIKPSVLKFTAASQAGKVIIYQSSYKRNEKVVKSIK